MKGSFLNHLEWRNASKAFDPQSSVEQKDLDLILESIRMAPTSFGLQPFHIVVVKNKGLQEKIQQAAWNQVQVSQASHLLVFCTRTDLEDRTESYLELASGGNESVREKLQGYGKMISGFVSGLDTASRRNWAHKQAYIALGFAHAACAELEVDSCPLEGFNPSQVDEILSLPEKGLNACVMLALGHRSKEFSPRPKVRFPKEEMFSFVSE